MRGSPARAALQTGSGAEGQPTRPIRQNATPRAGSVQNHILRRTGLRPLRFTGECLADTEIGIAAQRIILRFALYRSRETTYASVWSCEPEAGAAQAFLPWHEAHVVPSLEAAIAIFENALPICVYDSRVAQDALRAPFQQAAEIAAQEFALLREFASAAGIFLYELCVRGSVNPKGP
jgi:hypothetical protein